MAKTAISELPFPGKLSAEPTADGAARLRALFSFPVLLTAILGMWVFAIALRPMADPDIPWHLRNAAFLVGTHDWIHKDAYAYTTHGMPWLDHEWLAELPFYAAYYLFGTIGLLLATILLLEAIFLGLFVLIQQTSGDLKKAWITAAAGALLGTVSFGPRMLLFGWVCLVCELLLIEQFERKRGETGTITAFWPLIPLFLVWVNLHGSWLIGLGLFAAYIGCGWFTVDFGSIKRQGWTPQERSGLGLILAGSLAALFINPYGWRLPAYPFDFAFRQTLNVASIEEWQPLNMQSLRARVLLAVLAVSFVAQLVRRRAWAPYQLAFVLIGTFAALTHTRFLFLCSLLTLPYLAQDIPWPGYNQPAKERPSLHAALMLLLLAGGLKLTRTRVAAIGDASGYPTKALPFLRAFRADGPVLNNYLWGGYLELYAPNIPVFIDSRVDIFERRGVLRDYLDAAALKNSQAVLNKYSIRYVLFEDGSPLASFLRENAGWRVLYQDGTAVLFERQTRLQDVQVAGR